ncbi:hypothetical protein SAMN05660845_2340 [Flavobacterium swingsii]|uniref:4-amino-4-deoxy-L-arabinose transferase n=1 Tax=Flavobacterium swingsii TaxID=498292 RepID=A0A1I0ZTI2_9FLAO|nr:DUF6056 family protein [Flavobacterium swingsii]SFB27513.1 hypothetical protein SAMN05660845_2340 [Flavobacterium swingsii]
MFINFKYQKEYLNLLLIFGFLTVFLILLLCINTFYSADDYIFMNALNDKGILENCIEGYYKWDGRILTIGGFLQAFCLKYIQVEYITLLWSFCFLSSGSIIFYIVIEELNIRELSFKLKVLMSIITCVTLWIGSYTHISETIYWATGGFYSFDLLLGAIWLLLYLRLKKIKIKKQHLLLFIIFSIIVGDSTQNLSIGLITLVIIDLILIFLTDKKDNYLFSIAVLFSLIIGITIILVAPGNLARLNSIPELKDSITLFSITKGFIWVLLSYLKRSFVLFFIGILAAFGIYFLVYPNNSYQSKIRFYIPNTKEKLSCFLNDYKWLLIAISTTTPFIIMPIMASYRTTIYFIFFFEIFIITSILKADKSKETIHKNQSNLYIYLFSFIFCTVLIFTIFNLKKGNTLKQEISKREQILKNSRGKIVEIKLINPQLQSPCYYFSDFKISDTNNDSDFVKNGHEKYFKIKKIIVKE